MNEKTDGQEAPAGSGQAAGTAAVAGNGRPAATPTSEARENAAPETTPSNEPPVRNAADPALATRIEDMPLMARAEYYRTRIDPTRGERIIRAMKLLEPFTYDSENQHNHYKYASSAKVYGIVQKAISEAGLYLRTKLHSMEITEIDLPAAKSRQSNARNALTVRLDASFAFAAPEDGPDAVMAWERRIYWSPMRDIQSEQALWTYFRRYWLTDELLLSSFEASLEIDGRGDTDIDPEGVTRMERDRRTARNADRFEGPPPPGEHMEEIIDYDAIIKRGCAKNELTSREMEDIFLECGNDKGKVITMLSERYKKKIEREEAEKDAARTLEGGEHPGPDAQTADPNAPPTQPDAPPAERGERDDAPADPPAGSRNDTTSGADSELPGDRLSEDEIRPVYEKIVNAGIDKETMQRIVRDHLKAQKLTEVTVQQVTAARNAAGLQLSEDTRLSDILWAVIRDARSRINNPELDRSGAYLTDDELRPVHDKIARSDINDETMRRIVRDYIRADKLKDVTVEHVTAARDAAGLRLPEGTNLADTLWAVIRDANMKIEDQDSRSAESAEGAPAEATQSGDLKDHEYRSMADVSAKKLREIAPETAKRLSSRQYETQEARLNAYDLALATHRNNSAPQDAAPPPGAPAADAEDAPAPPASTTAREPGPGGDGEPPATLTIEEEIELVLSRNDLAEDDISTLRAMSKGDNRKLLRLIRTVIDSHKD